MLEEKVTKKSALFEREKSAQELLLNFYGLQTNSKGVPAYVLPEKDGEAGTVPLIPYEARDKFEAISGRMLDDDLLACDRVRASFAPRLKKEWMLNLLGRSTFRALARSADALASCFGGNPEIMHTLESCAYGPSQEDALVRKQFLQLFEIAKDYKGF
ncbi:hypothetical protein JW711_03220 [Candidatus Woesearchaeota archaeon]|nr:hypothetical protein [Candidatus Woesearchaeota archaeon]